MSKKKTKNNKLKKVIEEKETIDANQDQCVAPETAKNNEVTSKENEENFKSDKDVISEALNNNFGKVKKCCNAVWNFVKKNIVAIILVVAILVTVTNTAVHLIGGKYFKDYDDYEAYTIKYESLLSKNGQYYVYFYSDTCTHCQDLKTDIFQYLDSEKNKKGIRMYIFNIDKYIDSIASDTDNLIGVTDYKDIKILGTPTMIYISEKKINNSWASASTIRKQLSN